MDDELDLITDEELENITEEEFEEILDFITEELEELDEDEDDDDDDDEDEMKHYGVLGMKWGKRKGSSNVTTSSKSRRTMKKEANKKFQEGLSNLAKTGRKNDTKEVVKLQLQLAKDLKSAKKSGKTKDVSPKQAANKKFQEGLRNLAKQGKQNDTDAIVKLQQQLEKDLKAAKAKKKGGKEMKQSDLTNAILSDARKNGSLKEAFLEHSAQYGIEDIEQLFPNAKAVSSKPSFINNNVEWVNQVLGKVNQLPFARVKALFADISVETVRAKGYVKGNLKEEDVFALLKRTTEPFTIYKKGKLDRDDIVDITDFDVIAWIKESMRMKLDEELARAILIGDGRDSVDNDKIDEECIRPIYNDSDLFTIKIALGEESNKYKAFINAVTRGRKNYRGSGNPVLFTTEDLVSELLLLEDNNGRRIYKGVDELKSVLRVSDIVTVSAMVDLVRPTTDDKIHHVMGVIVNLSDYSVGADKGGKVSMFDDFDIDYNQQKYLIETRCSGALTIPYSAMVIEDIETPEPEVPPVEGE